jgi:hypothetical protein
MQPLGKPGAGHQAASNKRQAIQSYSKLQATGRRPATNCRASIWRIDMRFKLQAASNKRQATSGKLRRFINYSPDPDMISSFLINKGKKYENKN